MQHKSIGVVVAGFLVLVFVLASVAGATAQLSDESCPDVRRNHVTETLRVSVLRMNALSRCYDVRVPAGFVGVASLKDVSGDPKSSLSVLRYNHGLVDQEKGGTRQRSVFGNPFTDGAWYQVQLHHYGLSGEAELHLYLVDVTSAAMRGFFTGLGQVFAEETLNWILCQAIGCEETGNPGFQQAMVSRGTTLAVSTLQGRSLGAMTRDMAINEAGIYVRNQFGSAGGHSMTIIMAVTTEIIDSIYAH